MRHFVLSALLCLTTALAGAAAAPYDVTSEVPHSAVILDHGLAALEARLEMIERAQESIELEYFIYNPDQAGRLITQALVRKKKSNPNVKIRILVDASSAVLALTLPFTRELAKHDIEIRYYNPAPIVRIVTVQYRNHRKVLIVDGKEAITGGRNIADEYFDLSKEYNFIDRDIWVAGPIVKSIEQSFDVFWKSSAVKGRSQFKELFGAVKPEDVVKARDFLQETDTDRAVRAQVAELGGAQLRRDQNLRGQCGQVRFVTDEPGWDWGHNYESKKRHLRDALVSRIGEIPGGEEAYLETPYFLIKRTGEEVIENLLKRGVKAKILTNSLGSTDAFYVAAVFNSRAASVAERTGVEVSIYGAKPIPGTMYVKDSSGQAIAEKAIWGTHAKTFLFDHKSLGIGTFNVDPRSANLNTEMAILCENAPELATALRSSIDTRLALAHKLGRDGKPVDGAVGLLDGAGQKKVTLYFISMFPARLLDFLL